MPMIFTTFDNIPDFNPQLNDHHLDCVELFGMALFNNFNSRLSSFGDRKFTFSNEQLASFGFWYHFDPINKCMIKCSSCGLIVDLLTSTHPWLLHTNKYPQCPYVTSYIKNMQAIMSDISDRKNIPEDLLCIICCTFRRSKIFQPCCHLITCKNCAEKIKNTTNQCCLCRKEITDICNAIIS